MRIEPVENKYGKPIPKPIPFTSKIKRLYKAGKIKLDYDIYDLPLTPERASDEHIICRCYGGSSAESNIALADAHMNNLRGCRPIEQFVTIKMVNKYIERLLKNNPRMIGDYDLKAYCDGILKTFNRIFHNDI